MAYIDQAAKRSEKLIDAMENDKNISAATKKLLHRYVDFMRARGLEDNTIQKNLYCFAMFLKASGGKNPLRLGTEQVMNAIGTIERSKYSQNTKMNAKVTVKSFYKHFLGEDLYYPRQVAWIKTSMKEYKRVLPDDILDEDEILKMIKAAQNQRDKAIIALLFDSGIRVGELMSLRVKDIDLRKEPAHITVSGKTGMRKIPILFSVPYMAAYLNSMEESKPEQFAWGAIGSWSNMNRTVDYNGIRKMLKVVGKRAGIRKRIYPHLFRHSRATYYANKLTEQQLKVFMGWTSGSRQASTYVHLSGMDIDNAIMQVHGMKKGEEASRPKLMVRVCQRCRQNNAIDAQYCVRCGAVLEVSPALEQTDKEEKLRKMLVDSLDNPKLVEELVHSYLEKQRKRKK